MYDSSLPILIFFYFLLFAIIFIQIEDKNKIKSKIKELKEISEVLKNKNKNLSNEIKFQRDLCKTFSEGLEALTNKNKNNVRNI